MNLGNLKLATIRNSRAQLLILLLRTFKEMSNNISYISSEDEGVLRGIKVGRISITFSGAFFRNCRRPTLRSNNGNFLKIFIAFFRLLLFKFHNTQK